MNRVLPSILFAACALAGAPFRATAAGPSAAASHYLDGVSFDYAAILPAPPASGSLAELADLEAVLQAQAARSPADVAWAGRVAKNSPFNYADVLGTWFAPANLPFTAAFFSALGTDLSAASRQAKDVYRRRRPPAVDSRVHPCVPLPVSSSYPSGHSTSIWVWGELLAQAFPEKKTELFAFAGRAAWARIIGGVHFPSDDVGGRLLADALVKKLLENPDLRAALDKMRAEAQPFIAASAKAA